MIRILRFLSPYKKQVALVMGLTLVTAIANLYLPDLNASIIDDGIAKGDTDFILRQGLVMLGVTLALGVASVISVYWGSKKAMSFGRDVRHQIFRRVQAFSLAERKHLLQGVTEAIN